MAEDVFMGSDLNTVTCKLMADAARTGDKETAKLAAEYTKLYVEHEKAENEKIRHALEREEMQNRFEIEAKQRDRQYKLDIFKTVAFIGVTVGGICIENKYMISSYFMKTFFQKNAPK